MPNPATEARISPIIVSVCDILPTNIVKPTKKTIATKREIILPNVMKIFLTLSSLHKVPYTSSPQQHYQTLLILFF